MSTWLMRWLFKSTRQWLPPGAASAVLAMSLLAAPAHAQLPPPQVLPPLLATVSLSTTQISLRPDSQGYIKFDASVARVFGNNASLGAALCREIQAPLGLLNTLVVDPCPGQTLTPVRVSGDGNVIQAFILPPLQPLSFFVSRSSQRPRVTHLLLVQFGQPARTFVLRINLIEPPRGPELTETRLHFLTSGSRQSQGFFQIGQTLPPLQAELRFKGNGLLRARWEVVQPGDAEPTELDLTPEPYLSLEQRAQQRRWRLLQQVQVFLSPTGVTTLPGPDPTLLPSDRYGKYSVLLRIEPSQSLDGASGTTAPLVMPVLSYYIGVTPAAALCASSTPLPLRVLGPQGLVFSDRPLVFSWEGKPGVALYRVELERRGEMVYAARVQPDSSAGVERFTVPAFAQAQLGDDGLRWRVVSLADNGCGAGPSRWVDIQWGRVVSGQRPP